MKGYAVLALLTAVFLLFIPLPAFPRSAAKSTVTPTVSEPESSSSSDTTEAVFRIKTDTGIVTLDETEFLCRTLFYEMTPSYHPEALKAQAVAAYTYYSRRRQAQKTNPDASLEGADFAFTDSRFPNEYTPEKRKETFGSQFQAYENKILQAVEAVKGTVITYNGALIDACYFAISCGNTEDAETVWGNPVDYLKSVASPGDTLAPQYETVISLSPQEVKDALLKKNNSLSLDNDPKQWFGEPTLSAAGSVSHIRVGSLTLSGQDIRNALSLRSAAFTITYTDSTFRFTVHGFGHGVGMSQYGADYLARQGYTYDEILRYYYTGVTISSLSDG